VKKDRLLLDPCETPLAEHLFVSEDGSISGLDEKGQSLVDLLGLNKIGPRAVRQRCMRVLLLYEDRPDVPEVRALYLDYFDYPDDLPNLDSLRPKENSRPTGLERAYFRQRAEGKLPETYF
jgi:hypothetical protein